MLIEYPTKNDLFKCSIDMDLILDSTIYEDDWGVALGMVRLYNASCIVSKIKIDCAQPKNNELFFNNTFVRQFIKGHYFPRSCMEDNSLDRIKKSQERILENYKIGYEFVNRNLINNRDSMCEEFKKRISENENSSRIEILVMLTQTITSTISYLLDVAPIKFEEIE